MGVLGNIKTKTMKRLWGWISSRWEAEESKIGKWLKYYAGYIPIACGVATEVLQQTTTLFTAAGLTVPEVVPHAMVGVGLVAYIAGKLTKAKIINTIGTSSSSTTVQ